MWTGSRDEADTMQTIAKLKHEVIFAATYLFHSSFKVIYFIWVSV